LNAPRLAERSILRSTGAREAGGRRHVPSRKSVAKRVFLSYVLLTMTFLLAAGWAVIAQRDAAREARLMRSGYLPLSLALRDVIANQDTWNTQLNHITSAKNPADIRVWFETALRLGRPRMFGEVRAAISRAFTGHDSVRGVGRELMYETSSIQQFLEADRELVQKLFSALDQGDAPRAEKLGEELVTRGIAGKKRLSVLEQRVQRNVDQLFDLARSREQLAIRILVALSALTVLVGALLALHARRVLKPLAVVTERAKAVASGDLTPQPVVASEDEIGELARTFENMVSAIARANEQLLAAERLATIGKMAAHVTHEIRNPLSSMALNVELLEEELGGQEREARTLLRAIANEIERLTALTEQYLSVARRPAVRLEEENVGEVVREATEFIRRDFERQNVRVDLKIDGDLPQIRADDAQLKQALFNLLRNACEAMPGGGTVSIVVREAEAGGVEIVIDDEGGGIDASARDRLFEPFFTTKSHGTGLGLAITRQILEAHGGSIDCEARGPGGTRFRIHLPNDAASSPAPELTLAPVESRQEGRH
jgi:signal transduction histidine kinase